MDFHSWLKRQTALNENGDIAIDARGRPIASPGEATEQVVLSRTITLTDAQVKGLNSTPVGIVPAPASGQVIDFLRIYLVSHITTPYTNIGVNSYIYFLLGSVDLNAFVNNTTDLDTLLGVGGGSGLFRTSSIIPVGPSLNVNEATSGTGQPVGSFSTNDLLGEALNISYNNAGALTAGNAANTLSVTVLYTVIDLS